jgi:hypothetical protein
MTEHPYAYCKSWFWAEGRPTELWDEGQALQAHRNSGIYTVIVGKIEQPYAIIDVNRDTGFFGVTFLDERCREALAYHFREMSDETLFLNMAIHRKFVGDTTQVETGVSYSFSQDGTVFTVRERFSPHSVEEAESSFDVSANFEDRPEFGDYRQLLRKERG